MKSGERLQLFQFPDLHFYSIIAFLNLFTSRIFAIRDPFQLTQSALRIPRFYVTSVFLPRAMKPMPIMDKLRLENRGVDNYPHFV